MTGFEKTGLWPVRRHAAFEAIRKDIEKKNKPVPAEILNLLPYTGRYEKAGNTVRHIEEKYVNLMSSPTREAFTHVLAVVSEGSTMRRALKKTNEAKKERLAKSRSSRKKLVKPNQTPDQFARDDPFDTTGISLSFQEAKDRHNQSVTKANAKIQRREIDQRAAISRRQEQHQRAETKAEYEASKWKLDPTKLKKNGQPAKVRLSWEEWMIETGRCAADAEFLPSNREKWAPKRQRRSAQPSDVMTHDFGPDPSLFEGMYRASPLGYRGQISKQAFNRAQDEGSDEDDGVSFILEDSDQEGSNESNISECEEPELPLLPGPDDEAADDDAVGEGFGIRAFDNMLGTFSDALDAPDEADEENEANTVPLVPLVVPTGREPLWRQIDAMLASQRGGREYYRPEFPTGGDIEIYDGDVS